MDSDPVDGIEVGLDPFGDASDEGAEPVWREPVLDAVDLVVVSGAEAHPVGVFRRKLRALVESVRAVTLAERHEEVSARRRVVVEPRIVGSYEILILG